MNLYRLCLAVELFTALQTVLAIYNYLSFTHMSLSLSLSLVLYTSLALSVLCCCNLFVSQSQQFDAIGLEDCELMRGRGVEKRREREEKERERKEREK